MAEKVRELERLLDRLKADGSEENRQALFQCIQDKNLYLPAVLPADTDPALMRQLAQNGGREQVIPAGVSPRPAVLEDNTGKKYLPVFTQQSQIEKGKDKINYPLILGMPFEACMNLLQKENNLEGLVINPFSQNIIVKPDQQKEKKTVQLTEAQLHVVLRQQVEASLLPAALFREKEEGIRKLKEQGGAYLMEFYRPLYQQTGNCPYEEEDFEVMALNIREDLTVLRVGMPADKLAAGTCPVVIVAWNPKKKKVGYFGIVAGNKKDGARLMQALEDGSKKDLGEAPGEGSELNHILSLIDDKPELL